MAWLERKKGWIRPEGKAQRREAVEASYSIPEVSSILSVSRDVVYKWLALDCPDEAVIPPAAWYRLPNGRIRIKEWIVVKIQKGDA